MKNLMKAQWFQLLKSKKILILTVLVTLFIQLVEVFSPLINGDPAMSFGVYLASYGSSGYSLFTLSISAAAGVIIAIICTGGDYKDKTINYEIMNGYTRLEIFAAKSIIATIVGLAIYVVTIVIPCTINVLLFGFGTELEVSEVMLRFFLSLFVEIRLIWIFIAFTYFIRVFWIGIIFAAIYFISAPELLDGLSNHSYLLGMSTFGKLSEYVSWINYTLGDGVEYIYIYGRKFAMGESIAVILSSLGIGLVALFIGYFFFKKDDLQ